MCAVDEARPGSDRHYGVNQPHNFEVAAHGQKFLVNTIVGASDNHPLEVTLNWRTGLTK